MWFCCGIQMLVLGLWLLIFAGGYLIGNSINGYIYPSDLDILIWKSSISGISLSNLFVRLYSHLWVFSKNYSCRWWFRLINYSGMLVLRSPSLEQVIWFGFLPDFDEFEKIFYRFLFQWSSPLLRWGRPTKLIESDNWLVGVIWLEPTDHIWQ